MAVTTKQFLDYTGLSAYDSLIKEWANSVNQLGYKTILKSADGNTLNLYLAANATLSDTPDATVALGGGDAQTQLNALAAVVHATYNSSTGTYSLSDVDNTFSPSATTVVALLNELKGQINTLNANSSTSGSVAKSILDAVNALDVTEFAVATVSNNVVTIKGVKEDDGLIAVGTNSANDIVLEEVAYTGAAEDVSVDNTQMTGTYTATDAQGLFEEVTQALADSTAAGAVTVEETGESGSILKSYKFYQGVLQGDTAEQKEAKRITTVNIPKDFLVKSASVETVTTADVPYEGAVVGDKYIDFVVNTKEGTGVSDTHIYLPVNDLMAAMSGGTTADITVSIDAHNEITASVNNILASKVVYQGTQATPTETVAQALARIDGSESTTDSIREIVKNEYIDTLDSTASIASYDSSTTNITLKAGLTEADGIVTNNSSDDIVIAPIDTATINGLFTPASPSAGE